MLVVTADRTVAATLAASGIEVADDPLVGLNAAYDRGARLLRERDPRTAVGALQADLPALRPAELDAAIAAALASRRAGRSRPTPRAPARRSCSPRPGRRSTPVRRRLGRRGTAHRGRCRSPGRGRACAATSTHRPISPPPCALGVGAHTRAALGRCVISPSCQGPQTGASAPGWDRITAVGDDASRTPGTGPGPEEPKRGGNRSVNRRAPRPSTPPACRAAAAHAPPPTPPPPAAHLPPPPPPSGPPPRPPSRWTAPGRRSPKRSRAVPVSPPARTPAPASELPDDRYLNRELSWLDFNARVLALAEDPSQPLLERAKFLAIFASNLDEFYMVRVAGLKRRDETGLAVRSADGLSPARAAGPHRDAQPGHRRARTRGCSSTHVWPELDEQGIRILRWSDLSDDQRGGSSEYFLAQVFPVLTPLAVDPAHPFPYISGLSLNLAVTVRDPEGRTERFARVKVPNNVPRLVNVATDEPRGRSSCPSRT